MKSLAKKDNRSYFEKHEDLILFIVSTVAIALFFLSVLWFVGPLNPETLILRV